MKFSVFRIVFCVISARLVDALSSEEATEVTESCCSYAQGVAVTSASVAVCAAADPPEYIEPEQLVTCKAAILSCCEKQFEQKEACTAGMKLASTKKCNVPSTEIGKTCCDECFIGLLTGESQGAESCGKAPSVEDSPFSALRKNAYYQCCLEAAQKPTTTTEIPVETTTEQKKPKETCDNSGCEHSCDDEGGVVRCSCKEGFRLQADRKSCKDINECAEAIDDLCTGEDTVCHNVPGAFKCVPIKKRDVGLSCPPGFKRNVINQVCDDINECQLPRPPCPKYLCENTIGGYKCAGKPGKPFEEAVPGAPKAVTEPSATSPLPRSDICPPGFRAGADDECLDIDECSENIDDCQHLSQYCINTHGSFFCQDHVSKRCSPGFKVNSATGICEDIDECAEESSEVCKRSEVCINLPGAYNCKSKISQLPKLATKTCQEGTRLRPGGKVCEDIDECREGSHLCDQFQNCINTFGAHECRCKNGFELDSSSGSCVDIDECSLKLDNCGPGLHCLNDLGSFACTRRPPSSSTTTTTAPPLYEYEYYDSNEENRTDERDPISAIVPTTSSTTTPRPTLRPTPRSAPPRRPPSPPTTTHIPTTTTPSPTKTTPRQIPTTTTRATRPYPSYPDWRYYTTSSSTTRIPYIPSRPETTSRNPQPTTTKPEPEIHPGYTPPELDHIPEERRPSFDPYGTRPSTPDDKPDDTPTRPNYPRRPDYPYRPDYPRRPYPTRRPTTRRPESPTTTEKNNEVDDLFDPKEVHCLYGYEKDASGNCVEKEIRVNKPLDLKEVHCLNGYESDSNGNCVDVDECKSGRHSCGSMERCVNRVGSYTCECVSSFVRGDDGWCAPVTTSSTSTTTTERSTTETTTAVPVSSFYMTLHWSRHSETLALNFTRYMPTTAEWPITSYRPSTPRGSRVYKPLVCELGYRFESIQQRCVDINECTLNKDTCASEEDCVNMDGGYKCVCGRKCRAQNEKPNYGPAQPAPRQPSDSSDPGSNVITVGAQYGQRGSWSPNPSYSRDHNTGSYMVSCPWGYKLTNDKRCYDIDECAANSSDCGPQQRCENFYGGYSCQCPTGHKLVGQNDCEDIDECMHGNPCSYNAQCINTIGSYRCECSEGFRNAPTNDKVCVDIDECVETPTVCHQGCANAWGSYRCYCKRGYRLGNDNRTCVDVNECEEWTSVRLRGKLCGGECVNEPGSYRCACPSGYRLSEDQRSCIDIDECETREATCARSSDPGYVCQNTRGSYHCHHIDCPAGYRLESKHRCTRITQSCRISDWSCLQQPSTYSYNFITFVANIILPSGSVDLFTMHGPSWSDSVVSFEMRMVNVQASSGVTPADLRCFDMRPSGNICAISLLCSLGGPQVAELELTMSLYQHGQFAGSAVARLIIIVSQYEF